MCHTNNCIMMDNIMLYDLTLLVMKVLSAAIGRHEIDNLGTYSDTFLLKKRVRHGDNARPTYMLIPH